MFVLSYREICKRDPLKIYLGFEILFDFRSEVIEDVCEIYSELKIWKDMRWIVKRKLEHGFRQATKNMDFHAFFPLPAPLRSQNVPRKYWIEKILTFGFCTFEIQINRCWRCKNTENAFLFLIAVNRCIFFSDREVTRFSSIFTAWRLWFPEKYFLYIIIP